MSSSGFEATQPQGDSQGNFTNGGYPDSGTKIAQYVAEIVLYDRETEKWNRQSKRIVERYKDSRNTAKDGVDSNTACRFNVLWSNTQTLLPAIYSKSPKPDVQRRFKDADPVGRVASDVIERCVGYFVDTDQYSDVLRQCSIDYLLPGRGSAWTRYVPHIRTEGVGELTDDTVEGSDQKPEPLEIVDYEETVLDYVHREDFGHNICRTWDEVWCIWRKVYLTRNELIKRFKEKAKDVPLDHRDKTLKDQTLDDGISKATIFELWDKKRKVALWFHKDLPDALDMRDDPLKLINFWPCPKPLLTNLANDSLIPVPDFVEYQDQAIELDSLTARIASLTKAIKVAGVYDSSAQGIQRLLSEGTENQLIPVEQWAIFAEKGGIDGAISWMPLDQIVKALMAMYEARAKVKEDLYEITGISDLVRGQSQASESATAQQIKSNFATMRIGDRQKDVQRFARETVRLMADIICGHFQLDTIKKISGVRLFTQAEKQEIQQFQQASQMAQKAQAQSPQQGMSPAPQMPPPPPPKVLNGLKQEQVEIMMDDPTWEEVDGLLRDDAMRCFRIDIETDSTIKTDEEADKASRIEYIKAIGEYLREALPAGQQQPELIPFLCEGLMFLSRGFPVGKTMESALNVALQKLERAAQNPQPKQDPEMAKVQADAQARQAEMQSEAQLQQMKMQGEMQLEQAKIEASVKTEQAKAQSQAAVQQHLNEIEGQRESIKNQQDMELEKLKMQNQQELELAKARIQQQTAITVARISAKDTDGADEEAVAYAGDGQAAPQTKNDQLMSRLDALLAHLAEEKPAPASAPVQPAAPQHDPRLAEALGKLADAHVQSAHVMHKAMTAEKEVVRDKDGKAIGVRAKVNPSDLAREMAK